MLAKISHTHVEETVVHARVPPNYEVFKTGFLCHKFHEHEIITLMYIYHGLINTLSAHRTHINLDTIFHTHAEHNPTKTVHVKYYILHKIMPKPKPLFYAEANDCQHLLVMLSEVRRSLGVGLSRVLTTRRIEVRSLLEMRREIPSSSSQP